MNKKTIEEFIEVYNEASIDDKELAEIIVSEVEDGDLKKAATEFLKASEELENKLMEIGFEWG